MKGNETYTAVRDSLFRKDGGSLADITEPDSVILETALQIDRLRGDIAAKAGDLSRMYAKLSIEVEDVTRSHFDNPPAYSHLRETDLMVSELWTKRIFLSRLISALKGPEALAAYEAALKGSQKEDGK